MSGEKENAIDRIESEVAQMRDELSEMSAAHSAKIASAVAAITAMIDRQSAQIKAADAKRDSASSADAKIMVDGGKAQEESSTKTRRQDDLKPLVDEIRTLAKEMSAAISSIKNDSERPVAAETKAEDSRNKPDAISAAKDEILAAIRANDPRNMGLA